MDFLMNRFFKEKPKNYFKRERFMLKWLGLSLEGDETIAYNIFSLFFLVVGLYGYVAVECSQVFNHLIDFNAVMTSLIYSATHISGAVKIMVLYYNRVAIGKTLDSLERGVFAPDVNRGGEIEELLLKRCNFYVTIQAGIYIFSITNIVIFGVVAGLYNKFINENPEMPFGPLSILDVTKDSNYYIQFIYQTMNASFYGFIIVSMDLVIVGFLAHIYMQCQLLKNAINRSIKNAIVLQNQSEKRVISFKIEPSEIQWKYLHSIVKQNTDYYVEILKIADIFEGFFNIIALVIVLSTIMILCLLMYYASLNPLLSFRSFQIVCFCVGIGFQCFLYCFWGNKVSVESESILNSCYNAFSAGIDIKYQKCLIKTMQRSQKKISVTAGKFVDLNYATFFMIIKGSFSYYMVLQMVVAKNNEIM